MMLYLVVQVAHPPVAPPRSIYVHCVMKGKLDPVLWIFRNWQMGVGESEVCKHVERGEPAGSKIDGESNIS